MIILVINCGSSSFKYQLLDMNGEKLLSSGLVERIGEAKGAFTHKKYSGGETQVFESDEPFADHTAALKAVLSTLTSPDKGSIKSVEEITAIGHRVVQGGELIKQASIVGDREVEIIRNLSKLAPLHNPANLQGIEVAKALCPHAPSVAVFDTEFHASMPEEAFRYALPGKFYSELGIRRYGFHGTSHKFVSRKAAEVLNKPLKDLNMITCHLGNGCSMTAVKGGVSIDTSMGFTPLAGTIMGTRTGDMDPAIPVFLISQGYSPDEVDNIMNKQGGLKGVCGMNDLRDIHAAVKAGNKDAKLALDMFCYTIRRQLGALWACLGRVDAIVFTAGVGENDDIVRQKSLEGLDCWGVTLDAGLNAKRSKEARVISAATSRIPVLVVPTNEELEIARTTVEVLKG